MDEIEILKSQVSALESKVNNYEKLMMGMAVSLCYASKVDLNSFKRSFLLHAGLPAEVNDDPVMEVVQSMLKELDIHIEREKILKNLRDKRA